MHLPWAPNVADTVALQMSRSCQITGIAAQPRRSRLALEPRSLATALRLIAILLRGDIRFQDNIDSELRTVIGAVPSQNLVRPLAQARYLFLRTRGFIHGSDNWPPRHSTDLPTLPLAAIRRSVKARRSHRRGLAGHWLLALL